MTGTVENWIVTMAKLSARGRTELVRIRIRSTFTVDDGQIRVVIRERAYMSDGKVLEKDKSEGQTWQSRWTSVGKFDLAKLKEIIEQRGKLGWTILSSK